MARLEGQRSVSLEKEKDGKPKIEMEFGYGERAVTKSGIPIILWVNNKGKVEDLPLPRLVTPKGKSREIPDFDVD